MKRLAVGLLLVAGAGAAGLVCSEVLYRWPAARDIIARTFGHGELLALVNGVGIYATELTDEIDIAQLVIAENLRQRSSGEQVGEAEVERELSLLLYQFGDEQAFTKAVEASGLSATNLRDRVAAHVRAQKWVEKQIEQELIPATEADCRELYEARRERFVQPQRFRVNHLFLAAPEATPPEVVEAKAAAIKALATRLAKRENFAQLVTEASEDEATKPRGGDLGFFSRERMPEYFIAEIEKLRPGVRRPPFRSPLGFHILELTESKPGRQMEFEEVRAEIALQLANARRAAATDVLAGQLRTAEFLRTPL